MATSLELYSGSALATASGAIGATVMIGNSLQAAFGLNPRRTGFAAAMVLAIGLAAHVGIASLLDVIAVPVNGMFFYSSALGLRTSPLAPKRRSSPPPAAHGAAPEEVASPGRRSFWTPWQA